MKAILILLALAATPAVAQTLEQRAAQAVKARVADPYSAKVTEIRVKSKDTVCGKINAKNLFGAYVGSQPFLYIENSGNRHTVLAGDPLEGLLSSTCL